MNRLSAPHGRAYPCHLDYLVPRVMIAVTGTSPAMSCFYVLIRNDRNPSLNGRPLRLRHFRGLAPGAFRDSALNGFDEVLGLLRA